MNSSALSTNVKKFCHNTIYHFLRYAENAVRYSGISREAIAEPDETAVFWIEHVLKYGGSHLKTRAKELNFFQLHSIDVIAIFLVFGDSHLYQYLPLLQTYFILLLFEKKEQDRIVFF